MSDVSRALSLTIRRRDTLNLLPVTVMTTGWILARRDGSGKSGGYRARLSPRIGSRYVFLHGFPKSDKANFTQDEKKALQCAGKVFLELSAEALSKALQSGALLEVDCGQDH